MLEKVSGFTCRNGSDFCYFCGRAKGELHESECRWMTDLKVRNIINEMNLAYQAKAAADRRFDQANREYSELHAQYKQECSENDDLYDVISARNKRIREMRRHQKMIEAMFEALL